MPLGAGPQILLEVADLRIRAGLRHQLDVPAGVVVDPASDWLMKSMRSLIVSRSRASWALKLAISLMVLTFSSSLKRASKRGRSSPFKPASRRSYSRQRRQAHVHLDGLGLELLLEAAHRIDDALGQTRQALVLGVDALLQPLAHSCSRLSQDSTDS
jgi:hypothetical protein